MFVAYRSGRRLGLDALVCGEKPATTGETTVRARLANLVA